MCEYNYISIWKSTVISTISTTALHQLQKPILEQLEVLLLYSCCFYLLLFLLLWLCLQNKTQFIIQIGRVFKPYTPPHLSHENANLLQGLRITMCSILDCYLNDCMTMQPITHLNPWILMCPMMVIPPSCVSVRIKIQIIFNSVLSFKTSRESCCSRHIHYLSASAIGPESYIR